MSAKDVADGIGLFFGRIIMVLICIPLFVLGVTFTMVMVFWLIQLPFMLWHGQ